MLQNQNTKMLIGAVIAAALAFAVYYGLISQQAANNIQTQTNQTLGTTPASQQPAPQQPAPQAGPAQAPAPAPTAPAPAPNAPAPQTPAPPRQ